jgi:23S rRNA (pseudouridine1915-N3)-methyltransferase
VKTVKLIAVGKLKSPFFQEAARHYAKLLRRYHALQEIEIKDAPSSLDPDQRRRKEGEAILDRLGPQDLAVCLDERGRAATSRELAGLLQGWIEDPLLTPALVIGGPFGLSGEVRSRCRLSLSLGPMTLPHELARVVLLEQLYRAATIQRGLPYHHD